MTCKYSKNEEQGTNCKLIPSTNDHPVFCEIHSDTVVQNQRILCIELSVLLSVSKGDELYPFVKTFAHCSGRPVKAKDSCKGEAGFWKPVDW